MRSARELKAWWETYESARDEGLSIAHAAACASDMEEARRRRQAGNAWPTHQEIAEAAPASAASLRSALKRIGGGSES